MNERALRLDFVVAICALLVSGIAAGASAYQSWVVSQQFGASVWPYLSVDTTTSPNGAVVSLTNDGLGPALIRSAQLRVDGRIVKSWFEYFNVLNHDPTFVRVTKKSALRQASTSSVDASTTVRPGDSKMLVSLVLAKGIPVSLLLRHLVSLDICYCSLNDRCWTLRSSPGHARLTQFPQSVSHCEAGPRIDAAPI